MEHSDPGSARLPAGDAELVRRVLAGDREAYAAIVEQHKDSLATYLNSLLSDYHLAQDLTQDTFVRAYSSLHGFDPTKSLRNWLLGIAHHIYVDWRRKKREVPLREILDERTLVGRGTYLLRGRPVAEEDPALKEEERALMARAVASLPEEYRQVLSLRYVEGMKRGEIARHLGLTQFNVKMRLYRGKKELEKAFKRLAQ